MLRERNLLTEYSDNTIAFNMIILSFKIVQKHYNHVVYVLMSRIVGDNWDLEVKARCQTKSQNNKSLHYFHAYAVTDMIIPKGLSNQRPQKGIDAEVQESILSDLCYIIPRVIAEYLPTYKTFRKAVHYHYHYHILTRNDRKVRSGKLSMHKKMFQCYSMLINHIEGCPADHSKVVRLVSRPFKDRSRPFKDREGGGDRVLCVTKRPAPPASFLFKGHGSEHTTKIPYFDSSELICVSVPFFLNYRNL